MSFVNSMAATGETSTGAELETIQTEDIGFLSIAGDAKVRLTSAWTTAPCSTASLLTIAQKQGIVAAAGPDEIIIATTKAVRKAFEAPQDGDSQVRSLEPQLRIPMSMRVSHIVFTADEKYLLLSAESGGGLAVYETQNLLNGSTNTSFELSTEGQSLRAVIPNPTAEKAELCAIVTDNGNLHMANLQQQAISSPLKAQVSCLSWSAKGKQLCAGMADGTISQMTPEGEMKAQIPAPPGVQNAHVSSLLWLENNILLVIHTTTSSTPPESIYHIITRTPPSAYHYQKMTDPVLPYGDKAPHHTLLRLRDWDDLQDLLLVSSTAFSELGLLTRSKKALASDKPSNSITGVFTTTELLDDTKRPTLPMTDSMDDSVPVGVSLDLSSKDKVYKPIPSDEELEESATPLPGLWVMTHEGLLCSWWIIYNDSVKKRTAYPGIGVAQGDAAPQSASTAIPTSAFGAPSTASPFASSSGFGAPSQMGQSASPWGTPAAKTPSATGGAVFGSSSFGGAAQPATSPTFGKPSAFGQPSQLGIRSSPWAAGGKPAPAFGQSGFASFANGSSGAGNNSSASPFGSATASSNAPASGGFASFANKSGFASVAGSNSGTSVFASGHSGSTTSPFGASSAASDTAFPPKAQQDKPASSPFGSTPFKLESSFKKDATKDDENDSSAKPSGSSLFGSGFGSALSATQEKPAVTTPAAKDEEMDETEAMGQQATPQPDRTLAPAATQQDSTTPTTTPAPSKFGSFAASTTPAAPSTSSLFANNGASKPSGGLFGQPSKTENTSIFGQKKEDSAAPSSIFGQPSKNAVPSASPFGQASKTENSSGSVFGQPSKNESSTGSIFGQPSKNESSTKSIFGQPSKNESSTSSIFSKPSQTPAHNPFAVNPQQSQTANPFASLGTKSENAKKVKEEDKEDAPLPPDSTSKASYPIGDSSASSAASNATNKAASSNSKSTSSLFNQTKQPSTTFFSIDKSKLNEKYSDDSDTDEDEPSEAEGAGEDAPLPPDPTQMKKKPAEAASPEKASSIPVISEENEDDTEEDEEHEEGEDEEAEEDEEDEEAEEDEEENAEDDGDSEGSGVDVAKDLNLNDAGKTITPGYTPQGSFDVPSAGSPSTHSGVDVARSRPMFGEVSRNAPLFARPTETSPRSPSPVRSAVPGRMRGQESMRSVSAPGMASQMLGGRASQSRMNSSITARESVDLSDDPFMQQHRRQKAKQEAEESKPLVDEEDEEIQRILASEIEPTLSLDEFIAHSNVEPPAQESIPSQVEAVYKDINAMIDTLGLNSRSVKAFIKGHTEPASSEEKSQDDLDNVDDWVCCQVTELGEILEEDLHISLDEGQVDSLEDKLEVCHDLARDMHRLRAKQEDLKKILTTRMDPDQAEAAQTAPLSVEQATQQNELRREFAQFSKLLSETEEALTMLRTRIASLSGSSGKGNKSVPTVEAVMRTITKMTSMVEKRSGDIDVLENQMRKVNLNAVSREGSPAVNTPRRERTVMFSPDSTPSRTFRHSMSGSISQLGRATPPRKKLSGFSREEKLDLMEKKSRRQAVLSKLQANVEKRGVNVWTMEELE